MRILNTEPLPISSSLCNALRAGWFTFPGGPTFRNLDRIYPSTYHAYDFTPEQFGFVFKVRRRLEARRLLAACQGLPADALILDVGCGDGFHLALLRDFGEPGWHLEGVDSSERAVEAANRNNIRVQGGWMKCRCGSPVMTWSC